MAAIRSCKRFAFGCLILLLPPSLSADEAARALRVEAGGLFLETAPFSIEAVARHGGAVRARAGGPRMRTLPFDMAPATDFADRAARRRAELGALAPEIDTLRVLLVRVSFESDRLDALSSLSTGGDFDLAPGGSSPIDPTPHDRDYFASHLEGMSTYYRFQSCGRLEILFDIAPAGDEESYRLSDLADYGPGNTGSWTRERLVRFFRDCVGAADRGLANAGYPLQFGDFDALIVAHAGANLQSDAFGDTPNDVPSFFASLDPEDAVTVDGGATVVRAGSVISETACQDGFLGGIAGILAHEFGHQLGLPDLYDSRTGRTAVGYWDLMDAGAYLGAHIVDRPGGSALWAEGFVPGGLSAWSRSFLGWTAVERAETDPRNVTLSAAGKCPARAARLEHAADEYFLVENRAAELDQVRTGFVRDTNGVIVGTGNCLNCDGGVPEEPVWELVNGYDLLLPTERPADAPTSGPGILVWRVNERLVSERYETNTLNAERPLAVMLLEADGVAEIGDPSSSRAYGWHGDAYFAGGNTVLGEDSHPDSRSAWGAPTGVSMEGVTARDTAMSFAGGVRGVSAVAALPAREDPPADGFIGIPGDGDVLLLYENGDGVLLGSGDTVFSILRPVMGPPARVDGFAGTADPGVVVGELAGYIHTYRFADWSEYDGWPAFIQASLATHPVVLRRAEGCWIAAAAQRSIHILGPDGEEGAGSPVSIFERRIMSNLVVEADGEGYAEAVYFVTSPAEQASPGIQSVLLFKWILFPPGGGEVLDLAPGYPKRIPIEYEEWRDGFSLVGGDLVPGEDGNEVCLVCRATGRVLVFGDAGLLGDRAGRGPVRAAPALCDLNGDSSIDLIYCDEHSVHAMSPSGASLRGWPRSMDSLGELPLMTRFSTPVMAAVSGSARAVVLGSDAGLLYALDGGGRLVVRFPRKAAGAFHGSIEIEPSVEGRFAYVDGGVVRFRTPPFEADPERSWSTVWGDPARTAWAAPAESGSGGDWTGLAAGLVVYPNPSRGDRIGFHFTAPASGEARLEILTLTGELVLARTKQLRGGEDEFVVSMAGKASGVYLSRIIVNAEGRRIEAARTFAIVR